MIEDTLSALTAAVVRLTDNLDRIADALERHEANADIRSQVAALTRKTAAIVDPGDIPASPPAAPVAPVAKEVTKTTRAAKPTAPEPAVETSTPAGVDTPAEPAPAFATPPASAITHDTLRAYGRTIIAANGGSPAKFKAVLAEMGYAKVPDVPEDQLAAVAARLEKETVAL